MATPHGGGIAIALTWFGGLFYLHVSDKIEPTLFDVLMLGMLISVVSYLDDLFDLSPKIRLFTQSGVALGALYFLGGLHVADFGVFSIQNQFIT